MEMLLDKENVTLKNIRMMQTRTYPLALLVSLFINEAVSRKIISYQYYLSNVVPILFRPICVASLLFNC
jgi:hypothetical protein